MCSTIDALVADVLNKEKVRSHVHKILSVPKIMKNFASAETSALILGQRHCWVVSAITSHLGHSVGTKRVISLKANGKDTNKWKLVE